MSTLDVPAGDQPADEQVKVRLWDLPLRLFHWSLVGTVVTAIVTGQLGGSLMTMHAQIGQGIAGLVVFRLVWGLIGSTHARFKHFAPTPARIRAYVQGKWQGLGHNPLGALSVFALLSLLAAQVGTGLFSNDDITYTAPLASLVGEGLSSRLTGVHHLLSKALFGLLALHVLAIAFYAVIKKDNLVRPMITGHKSVDVAQALHAAKLHGGHPTAPKGGWLAFSTALGAALAAVYLVSGALLPQ